MPENLETLRSYTKESHRNLEKLMYSKNIMNYTLTKNQLIHLLTVNYYFFHRIETYLSSHFSNRPYKIDRAATARQNLEDLGITISPQPVFSIRNVINNEEGYYGLLYVALGSSLGGKLIAKKLDENSNLVGTSYSFFKNAGTEIAQWKIFLSDLETRKLDQKLLGEAAREEFSNMNFLFHQTG